ncbi:hypothetical protein, partial [Streptococcus anginosus]|uniref:hypothetical protein n=1 Tax=Streptococcus anginosus TaxID=1328 RepID=UPI002ED90E5C
VWKPVHTELHLAYPVYVDADQQRYHEPLDFKVIKSLMESVGRMELWPHLPYLRLRSYTDFA